MSEWSDVEGWQAVPGGPRGAEFAGPEPTDTWSWRAQWAAPPVGTFADAPSLPPQAKPRYRGTIRSLLSAAGALTVIAVILPVLGSSTPASADVLVAAAKNSLGQQSADLSLSGSVNADGQSFPIGGSGAAEFNKAEQLNMNISAGGQSETVTVVDVSGTVYEQVPGISEVEPGKSWISMDLSALAKSAGVSGGSTTAANPSTMFALIEQEGYSVTPLGPSVVDGTNVNGYEVVMSGSQIQSELHKLPSWLQQDASQFTTTGIREDVYIDGNDQFRRLTEQLQYGEGSVTVGGTINLDFSDYGAPVSISAPPADQTVPLQQFIQDAKSEGTSPSTSG